MKLCEWCGINPVEDDMYHSCEECAQSRDVPFVRTRLPENP